MAKMHCDILHIFRVTAICCIRNMTNRSTDNIPKCTCLVTLIALILVKLSKFACADRKGRNSVENNACVCESEWANLCGYRSYSKNSIGIDCHTMLAMLSFTDSHTNALSATQIANRDEQHQKKSATTKSK